MNTANPTGKSATATSKTRLQAIDWLRGIVMVVMALDHARDYFGDFRVDPLDLTTTAPALFLTRWMTHVCAPVFVCLAGMSAWLYQAGGRSPRQVSWFLATRGVWLVALEFTVIYFGWTQTFTIGVWFLQVVAAIGLSMLALAGLIFLPRPAIAGIAIAIICGHNLLDPINAASLPEGAWLWVLFHDGFGHSQVPIVLGPQGPLLLVVYPLLPWIGVMALGYCLGPLWQRPPEQRRKAFTSLGIAAIVAFVVLRWANVYGDPSPWTKQSTISWTLLSFVNCEKYPPSLLFLLMTLGPSILALRWLDKRPGVIGRTFITFGRVPLFYYVLHLYVLSLGSRLFHWLSFGQAFSSMGDGMRMLFTGQQIPSWYGQSLWVVYAAWLLAIASLYWPCLWFAGIKRRSSHPLLRYV